MGFVLERAAIAGSAPVRMGVSELWTHFGELVEETTAACSIQLARHSAACWLERHVGTELAFISRLDQGKAKAYARHIDGALVDRLFDEGARYADGVGRLTRRVVSEQGALVSRMEPIRDLGGALVDEILAPARAPIGVLGAVNVWGGPVLHAYFGHAGDLEPVRPILVAVMRLLSMSELAFEPRTAPNAVDRGADAGELRGAPLTPREREVLEYLALGYRNHEIAAACGNACATVKRQVAAIFRKLDVSTRSEAVRIAMLEGHVTSRAPHKVFG